MIYYLYVKTHNITGLKYLGQTRSSDPHAYSGSGVYWKKHLKIHGSNYKTEILLATQLKSDLIETGEFFSKLWNIVESKDWANLTEEKGAGGNLFTEETYSKIKQTKLERYGDPYYNNRDKVCLKYGVSNISQLQDVKSKISKSLKGKPKSESHKANMRKPKSNEGKSNIARAARRNIYTYGPDTFTDAKLYCAENNLSYQMLLKHAKNGSPYKGQIVGVRNAG